MTAAEEKRYAMYHSYSIKYSLVVLQWSYIFTLLGLDNLNNMTQNTIASTLLNW